MRNVAHKEIVRHRWTGYCDHCPAWVEAPTREGLDLEYRHHLMHTHNLYEEDEGLPQNPAEWLASLGSMT